MNEKSTQTAKNPISSLSALTPLVDEILGKALEQYLSESEKFLDFYSQRHVSFVDKGLERIKSQSITGFFYESYDFMKAVHRRLEEYVKFVNSAPMETIFRDFNRKILLSLSIIQEDSLAPSDRKKEGQAWFGKSAINQLFSKQKENPQYAACLYITTILPILEEQVVKSGDLEKMHLDFLLKLWEENKKIGKLVIKLSQSGFDLSVIREDLQALKSTEPAESLFKTFRQDSKKLLESLKENLVNNDRIQMNEKSFDELEKKEKAKFRQPHLISVSTAFEKKYKRNEEAWHNTLVALSDDWLLEMEINALRFNILKDYLSFNSVVDNQLKGPLSTKVEQIIDLVTRLMRLVDEMDQDDVEGVMEVMVKNKLDFRRKLLLKILPEIKDVLLGSNLPNIVDEFEKNTKKQFELLSRSRVLVTNPVYDQPVDQSDLNRISPYALVSFDMQPGMMKIFPALKSALIRQLQWVQDKLEEIPEIVEYSIESSISYYQAHHDLKESMKIGRDGIHRALNKLSDLTTKQDAFYANEIDHLGDRIYHLINEISEITDSESALQIKIRVAKAKAMEKSRAVRIRILNRIKYFIPRIMVKLRLAFEFLLETSIKIRKQFELESKRGYISTDISDYLAETETAVGRLPFVYQRLFKIEPLKAFDLYIEPTEAANKLNKAYSRWQEGKFAPTIVTGENGTGKTSFINKFIAAKNIREQVIYFDLHSEDWIREHSIGHLFNTLADNIDKDESLRTEDEKKIVIIDGVERLFEARINGFDHLNDLMKWISDTHRYIFWLLSCNLYSYRYIDKVMTFSDYFGYHIQLEDIEVQKLIKIIDKRHNISGYRLNFLSKSPKKTMLPLVKNDDEDNQVALRKEYFEKLHTTVKGNITQAFLYWMRSAANVTEDIIYMNPLSESEEDFIKSISLSKLEILKNILIHNGITEESHTRIYRIPVGKSQLQLSQLFDDGIIVRHSGVYHINPIIYKQVVERLFNLNLLH